jgi:hypothetical protein
MALRRRHRVSWSAAALIAYMGAVLIGTGAYAAVSHVSPSHPVSHVSRAHPFPRPTGPTRTVASIRTLSTHRVIVLQVWPGRSGHGTTLITPGGVSRGCCSRPPKPTKLAVYPEQIGRLPRPGMLLLWGAVGSRIRTLQLRFEDETRVPLRIQNRHTLYQVSPRKLIRGHRPVELIGRDESGRVVTTERIAFPR